MPRPNATEYGNFYQKYIDRTTDSDAAELLQNSVEPLGTFLKSIPESKGNYAYDTGKWTLKQLVQHCIDTERIMCYRALCVARGDQQSLPGFDENIYADSATAALRTLEDLTEEFLLIRMGTVALFKSFDDAALSRIGTANHFPITANALAFIIVGHMWHHKAIIEERYL